MIKEITKGVKIEVQSHYVPEESRPETSEYFFAYNVRITNEGSEAVQLLNRRWLITDGLGRREEIQGPGVVGLQPYLRPGESFEYDSFCPLETPMGQMEGAYEMQDSKGASFDAKIPEFYLIDPDARH